MSRQIIHLERTRGTSDGECQAFIHDLYRELNGMRAGSSQQATDLEVAGDEQEVVVVAPDNFDAVLLLTRAAMRADPCWRRLYRLTM